MYNIIRICKGKRTILNSNRQEKEAQTIIGIWQNYYQYQGDGSVIKLEKVR